MSSRVHLRILIGERDDGVSGSLISQAGQTNGRRDEGIALLRKHISLNAFQDPNNFSEPIPSPGADSLSETDQAILDRIKPWLEDAERRRKFLRIGESSQPSAITHSIAAEELEEICREGDILGASFSFSRRTAATATTGHDDAQKARMTLIPTIAYQLSYNIPEIQDSIASVALNDLSVFTRSIVSQMMELIVKPLLRLRAIPTPRVVVIEGLNATEGSGSKEVMEAITQCLQGYDIPIGFVLVSSSSVGGVKMPRRYPRVTRQ